MACASGTDALWLGIAAAGIQPGGSVITTPFSFFATASSIIRAGARPIFVDVDPETLNIAPAEIERKLKSALPLPQAIMPVHLYGQCADMDAIGRLAAEFKLLVIEDAAQASGAAWNGKPAGSLGECGRRWFLHQKPQCLWRCRNPDQQRSCPGRASERAAPNHGSRQRYSHDEIGANSRMDSIQAAVLRVKMRRLPAWNEARRTRARIHTELLSGMPSLTRTSANSKAPVSVLKTRTEAKHIFHQYVLRVQQRDKLRDFLKDRGVSTEIYYPVPLHMQKCFGYLGYAPGDLPEAEQAAKEVLALPMFPELEDHEQRYVVEAIAEFYS